MFKMGCSMARKILAIDGKSPTSGPEAGASTSADNNGKKSKENQQSGGTGTGTGTGSKQEELNDFSKLEEDPRLPLNVRQIFKITKSWKAIARTMSKTGTAMFLNLFEQNQDLFYLFSRFQHLKGRELHESMELREHAATVMSTLDQSINSLSDYDNFVNYLHSIGKLHRKVPGFKREHFWKIEQPFLKAVKQTLDERCNETIEEIYRIAIKLIIETIAEGYGEDRPDLEGSSPFKAYDGDHDGNGNGGGANSDKSSGQSGGQGPANSKTTRTTNSSSSSDGSSKQLGSARGKQAATTTTTAARGQQDTITSQPGENSRQKLDDKFEAKLLAAASNGETTLEASKQDSCRCPIGKKKNSNQGQNATIVATDTSQRQSNNDENDRDDYHYDRQDRERVLAAEDRLKTTIICLKELLALAVKGVPAEPEQRTDSNSCKSEISGSCTERGYNSSNTNNTETELSEAQSFGAGSSWTGRQAEQPNEWATLIGRRANETSKSYFSHTIHNEQVRHQRPRGRASSLFKRFLLLVDSRKSRRISEKKKEGFNELVDASQPLEAATGTTTTTAAMVTETTSTRMVGGVYLIEKGAPPLVGDGVVKRCNEKKKDLTSCDGGGDHNDLPLLRDSYRDDHELLSPQLLAATDATITAPSSVGLHCVETNNNDISSQLATTTSTRVSSCGSSSGGSSGGNGSRDGDGKQEDEEEEEEDQSPRSIVGDKTSDGSSSSRRLTTLLLRPIDDDEEGRHCRHYGTEERLGPAGLKGQDRYSTRPCNESNSLIQRPADNTISTTSGGRLIQLEPSKVADGTTPAVGADMLLPLHSRDHNNDWNNLEGNEQRNETISTAASMEGNVCWLPQPTTTTTTVDKDQKADGVGRLSSRRSFRIKQSSRAMEWLTKRSIVTLLSRAAHKFNNAAGHNFTRSGPAAAVVTVTASSGSGADTDEANRPEVNENKDLVLRMNGGAGDADADDGQCGSNSRECNHHHSSPLPSPMEAPTPRTGNKKGSQFAKRGQQLEPSCSAESVCPAITTRTTITTTTTTSTLTTTTRVENKQIQSKRPVVVTAATPTTIKSVSTRLSSNAGDLGELIKMLMLTLLTSNTTSGNNGSLQPKLMVA